MSENGCRVTPGCVLTHGHYCERETGTLSAPTAAERWRAVPAHAREALIAELETDAAELASAFGVNSAGKPWADHAAAAAALLALAREAEGGR